MLRRSLGFPRIKATRLPSNIRMRSTKSQSIAAGAALRAARVFGRASSFTFHTGIFLGGLGLIGVCGYYLVHELVLPSSDVQIFQRSFALIEKDAKSQQLLGTKMKAHGEDTRSRNTINRPLATKRGVDMYGREHVKMQFHVDGDKASGVVRLELIDNRGHLDYRYLVLEVPGHSNHFLINKEPQRPKGTGLFGIKWGPRKSE